MSDYQMKPVKLDQMILEKRKPKIDPAYREISNGLMKEIQEILRDPNRLTISCCIEGCCVSWCCIQIT